MEANLRQRTPRRLKTRSTVLVAEFVSRWLITIGGAGTIVAVLMVCVFLVIKVLPLFRPARLEDETFLPKAPASASATEGLPAGKVLRMQLDEYQTMAYVLLDSGELAVIRLDNGRVLARSQLFPDATITAISSPGRSEDVAIGFADGKVSLGTIQFKTKSLFGDTLASALQAAGKDRLAVGEQVEYKKGLLVRVNEDQYRLETVAAEFQDPLEAQSPSPVVAIDFARPASGPMYCAVTSDRVLWINSLNKLPDETMTPSDGGKLPLPDGKDLPSFALLTGLADNVFVAWSNGHVVRVATSPVTEPKVVETTELLDNSSQRLTALTFLINKTTLLAGDSEGRVRGWFTVHDEKPRGADGVTLKMAHEMRSGSAAVTALHPSSRSRMLAAGYENGSVRVFQVTAESALVTASAQDGDAVQIAELSPRDDGLIALNAKGLTHWQFDPGHPEVTLRTLFLPVWYEGSPKPDHTWQSKSADEGYEPKFGLTALVFGTLKATFYSMIIAVPLALLSAVYTSEFMNPRIKGLVKPSIELMASLPSVVLGFLAGLVFAPFIEHYLSAALALLLTLPLTFLLGGHLWQLVPESRRVVLSRWRLPFIALCLPIAILAALFVGPMVERILFLDPAGKPNFRGWLDGHWGSALSGWVLLLLPACAVFAVYLIATFVNPWLDDRMRAWERHKSASVSIAKFVTGCLMTVVLSLALGELLTLCRLDPRGPFLGTYIQRNALIVGLGMGFAIIPIIYTIADDALSSVPGHLRSASLGCGATPWQTAMRVILPTAASGLFSAIMIGLGRAVGETMIVLMATGNTPIIDLNPFNGFLTLSANLATEMKEAARGSSHELTLYLGALILFTITFVLNTTAEAVRQRFRKRAVQL